MVIATNDGATNARIARDARDAGVLANRADAPDAGDLSIPAHAHHGPITLAVHTGGISAAAAAAIRRELSGAMDADWPRLLELVAPYRSKIQAAFTDGSHRTDRLTRLADADAMDTLKQHGPDALLARCESLLNPHIAVSHSSEACR